MQQPLASRPFTNIAHNATMRGRLNVLITGAGIGGPATAFWLSKVGAKCTIVERSPTPRKTGQAIDIRGPGVQIMRKMGLEAAVRACNTTEKGMEKIGSTGKVIATLESSGDAEHQVMTSEFEILRADLARVFADALPNDVEMVYGDYVNAIEQRDNKVFVNYANGRAPANYDLVIGADGISSRTRSLVTGRPAGEDLKKSQGYVAYFTIPRIDTDSERHARLYTATKGRSILLRPTRCKEEIGALLTVVNPADGRLEAAVSQGVNAQKELLRSIFQDAGWESKRLCEAMTEADDFYYQQSAQVRLDEWVYGRVALVGDAAHAVSVMGTSAAMCDGYVLAGEIAKHPDDLPEALASYQRVMRPRLEKWQKEPEWIAKVFNPQTQLAIDVVNTLWRGLLAIKVDKLGARLAAFMGEEEPMPEYDLAEAS